MTVYERYFRSANQVCRYLEKLAVNDDNYIFRGHTSKKYRLATSLERHERVFPSIQDDSIDEYLGRFRSVLKRHDKTPFTDNDRWAWLEYARHHGLPTPVLDFTWSPYISLFFAFDGVKARYTQNRSTYSVIYALNIFQLAQYWARVHKRAKGQWRTDCAREFAWPEELYKEPFQDNDIRFVRFSSGNTRRMNIQQGVFLYCTLDYKGRKIKDLETYFERLEEAPTPKEINKSRHSDFSHPVLTKLYIPHNLARDIFSRLEMMNISGASLFENPEGVAKDIDNSVNYEPKTQTFRDTRKTQ